MKPPQTECCDRKLGRKCESGGEEVFCELRLDNTFMAIKALIQRWIGVIAALSALWVPLVDARAAAVTFAAGGGNVARGSLATVAVQVSGFGGVTTFQFTMQWDPSALQFNSVGSFGLPELDLGKFNTSSATSAGVLTVSWDDPLAVGTVLADGSVIFAVQFTAVGAIGSSAQVSFSDSIAEREVTANLVVVPFVGQLGTVAIEAPVGQDPVISWGVPSPLSYGTALGGGELNATASVGGTFAYTPGPGTVLGAGSQTLSVIFTPADTVGFNTAAKAVGLTVNPQALTAVADNKSRSPGQPNPLLTVSYSGFVNGEGVSVLTTQPLLATDAVGESGPGGYAITFSVEPHAPNYQVTTANGLLTVGAKQDPQITWVVPAAVTYGTPLGTAQLNASANVAGTFVYTPAAGAVLGAGEQTLGVTFAPTDTAGFTTTTRTVILIVNKKVLTVTASNQSRVYGAANPVFGITMTGFVGGETAAALTQQPSASSTALATSPAGSYLITPSGGTAGNYTFAYVAGSLTVTPAALLAQADNKTRPSGSANPLLTVMYAGFVSGEGVAVVTTQPVLITTASAASSAGDYPISFATAPKASNYEITTASGVLTVTAVKSVPILTLPQSVALDENVASASFVVGVADADGPAGSIVVRAISQDEKLVSNVGIQVIGEGSSRTVLFSPVLGASGKVDIRIEAKDLDGGLALGVVRVEIRAVNRAPGVGQIAEVVLDENGPPAEVRVTVSDIEQGSERVVLSVVSSSNGALLTVGGLTLSGEGGERLLRIKPAANQFGRSLVRLVAKDGVGGETVAEFVVEVRALSNTPPRFVTTFAAQVMDEDSGARLIAFGVSDRESGGDSLTYEARSDNSRLVDQASIQFGGTGNNRTLSFAALLDAFGSASITVRVSDSNGASAEQTFALTVRPINDNPLIDSFNGLDEKAGVLSVVLPENERAVVAFSVRDAETSSDQIGVTGQSSTPSLLTADSLKLKGGGASRYVELQAASGQIGSTTIVLIARDPNGGESRVQFNVVVVAVNHLPTIAGLKDLQVESGRSTAPLQFVVADDETPFNRLKVTVVSENQALLLNSGIQLTAGIGGRWTLVATPVSGNYGVVVISIFVQDEAGATTIGRLGIKVDVLNKAPEVLSPESITMNEDTSADIRVQIGDDRTPKDKIEITLEPETPSVLSVVLVSRPLGTSQAILGEPFVIRVRPALNFFGETRFVIRARDAEGAFSTQTVDVRVSSVNDVPTLAEIAVQRGVEDQEQGPVEIVASDLETPLQRLTFSGRPVADGLFGFRFEVQNGKSLMWIKPDPDYFGTVQALVEITDEGGLKAARTFSVAFAAVNDAPIIEAIADLRSDANKVVDVPVRITDDDPLESVRLTVVSSNPTLLSASGIEVIGTGSDRVLRLRPSAGLSGETKIRLQATDSSAAVGTRDFTWTVLPGNTIPTLSGLNNLVVVEGQRSVPVSFSVAAEGVDPNSIKATVKSSDANLLKDAKIQVLGTGAVRQLVVTPEAGSVGNLTLDVVLENSQGLSSRQTVSVRVTRRPTVSDLTSRRIVIPQNQVSDRIPFEINDEESPAKDLTVVAGTSDPDLLPLESIEMTGNASQRSVTLSPGVNRIGSVLVSLTVRDPDGGEARTSFVVEVRQVVPVITLERSGFVTRVGSAIELRGVLSRGSEPINYQWQFEGSDLGGETSPTLLLENLTPSKQGTYRLIAGNGEGKSEATARVVVVAKPDIIEEPQDLTVVLGSDLILRVRAQGQALRYQWRRNGELLIGETSSTFVIPRVRSEDGGTYSVEVFVEAQDEGGDLIRVGIPSRPAVVTVLVDTMQMADKLANIVDMPTGVVVNLPDGRLTLRGSGRSNNLNATFDAVVGETQIFGHGSSSVWVKWKAPRDGVMRLNTGGSSFDTVMAFYEPGANSLNHRQLILRGSNDDSEQAFGGGASEVVFSSVKDHVYYISVDGVRNYRGVIVLNWEFVETIIPVPELVEGGDIHDVQALVGETAYFSVLARNATVYRWKRLRSVGGQTTETILAATGPELRITAVTAGDAALYQVTISNGRDEIIRSARLVVVSTGQGLLVNNKLGGGQGTTGAQSQSLVSRQQFGVRKLSAAAASGFRGTQVFNTVKSTVEQGEPAMCDIIGGASQWTPYVAPADGLLRVSTEGSSFDTLMGVFTGPAEQGFEALTLLGCDNNGGSDKKTSVVTVHVKSGQSYYIAVDGVNGQVGFVNLTYDLSKPDISVTLSAPGLERGVIQLKVPGVLGAKYVLQSSVNLVGWRTVLVTNASTPTVVFRDTESGTVPTRFYRLVKE